LAATKRKVLIDAQLPPALARAIVQEGYPAEHVFDIRLVRASDEAIWKCAEASGAILITKDEDFATRGKYLRDAVPVVWLRLGNTSRKALLERFLPLLPTVMSLIAGGETLVEIRPRQGGRATIMRPRR
jgi:predicted nuclease of predicted toxin-antitoxin system